MFIKKIKKLHYKNLFIFGIYNSVIILSVITFFIDLAIGSITDAYIDLFFAILALISYLLLFSKGKITESAYAIFWLSVFIEFVYLEVHSIDFNIIFTLFIPIIAYISMPKKMIFINLLIYYMLLILYLYYHYSNDDYNIFLHNKKYLVIYIMANLFILSFGLFYNLAIEESIRRLQESNRSKELLLNEVHHRVKNNLNLVASILALNAQTIQDTQTEEFLHANEKRIESMAILHEILYKQHSSNSTDLSIYVDRLSSHILRSIAQKDVIINCNIIHLELPINSMIQFGIILNEMLTNSIKHKNSKQKLTINILFKQCDKYYCLGYCDNSKLGNIDKLKSGFGYKLITLAAKHFNAEITVDNSDGLCYKIKLKKGWHVE